MYGSSEFLNSYRYSIAAGQSCTNLNATVTSNGIEAHKHSHYSIPPSIPLTIHPTTEQPTTTTTLTNSHPNLNTFPKHWMWNRNIFYSNIANSTNYLSYLNANNALNLSDLSSLSNRSESLNSSSPAQITEINSDDSLDSQSVDVS